MNFQPIKKPAYAGFFFVLTNWLFNNCNLFSDYSIACYQGFYATGGASGVGKATTSTVVLSCISVVVLDYILAALLLWLK